MEFFFVLFCFVFGRSKNKNVVLFHFDFTWKNNKEEEWYGVSPIVPELVDCSEAWRGERLRPKSEGTVFTRNLRDSGLELEPREGGQSCICFQRGPPAPPGTGSWWVPTEVAVGLGGEKSLEGHGANKEGVGSWRLAQKKAGTKGVQPEASTKSCQKNFLVGTWLLQKPPAQGLTSMATTSTGKCPTPSQSPWSSPAHTPHSSCRDVC